MDSEIFTEAFLVIVLVAMAFLAFHWIFDPASFDVFGNIFAQATRGLN
jgi:hypothetical protein